MALYKTGAPFETRLLARGDPERPVPDPKPMRTDEEGAVDAFLRSFDTREPPDF